MVVEITSAVELKKLELREREKEQEVELCLKELEFKERELAIQLKIRELELAAATPTSTSRYTEFDVSKQICFAPVFQQHGVDKYFLRFENKQDGVDKYFLRFENIASSLEWPKQVWTLLLQSILLGKAQEAYSAMSVDHSSDYDNVKSGILKAYKLVPEAYHQKFQTSKKTEFQTQ